MTQAELEDERSSAGVSTQIARQPLPFSAYLTGQRQLSPRAQSRVRIILFSYLSLALCPIQYFPLAKDIDNTWIFAINYGAANHLVIGRDIFWTWGPLAYLGFPMDIGRNLAFGLLFQTALWAILIAILWDLFFRSGIRLRNLILFSLFFGLSAAVPGAEEVFLRCSLILLIQYHLRGNISRYLGALAILGVIPLIKFTAAIVSVGVIAGWVIYRVVDRRSGWPREIALAFLVPTAIAAAGFWWATGSLKTLPAYLHTSVELSSGFNTAMSLWSSRVELLAAFEAFVFLAIALYCLARQSRRMSLLFTLVFAVPLFLNFKHGFVRQDVHIAHFFCFVAVALGLIALVTAIEEQRTILIFAGITLVFISIWQDNVARRAFPDSLMATGLKAPWTLWNALRYGHLRQSLAARSQQAFENIRLEPEIKRIVGHEPVSSLSVTYSNLYFEGMNLQLYPVVQRYSAYTPYLDELNARWVRERGPRFLIFDGQAIDGRHPWTETPAMLAEVYRWYDTRLLGYRNLLLERRPRPRFEQYEFVSSARVRSGEAIRFPATSTQVFWSMNCPLRTSGKLRALLFRVPEVAMNVSRSGGSSADFRVPLAVLGSPSPGNHLPTDLGEFAEFFSGEENRISQVEKISFSGAGRSAYAPSCTVQFWQPVH